MGLIGDAAITRLKANEERFDDFVNDPVGYTDSAGVAHESLQAFTARVDGITDEVITARDDTIEARDAALIQAGVYVDVATGRAAVADGVAYKVQGTGVIAAYEYRRVNSTTSTLIATYPSSAAVNAVNDQAGATSNAVSPLLAAAGEYLMSEDNSEHLAWGVGDDEGRTALGITESGGVYTASGTEEALGENSEDLQYGIVDLDGNIVFGIRSDGAIRTAAGYEEVMSDDNNQDFCWSIVDAIGNIAIGITSTGEVIIPGQSVGNGSLFVDSGDVYLVAGGNTTRLTTSADNRAPRFVMPDTVRLVSNRRRGVDAEYDVGIEGSGSRRFYDKTKAYEHVLVTGQSLALGWDATAITTTPPYPLNAFTFNNGPVGGRDEAIPVTSAVIELEESGWETLCSGFAKQLLDESRDRKLVVSGQARGGTPYDGIKKGAEYGVFEACIEQVSFSSALPGESNVRAVFLIHGEDDGYRGNIHYDDDLVELITDYNADIKATSGQTESVVLLTCQTSSAAGYRELALRDTFTSPFLQLAAAENNPNIFLVTPKYHLEYSGRAHITAISEQMLGEHYAKVYRKVVIEGEDWKPLSPKSVVVVGSAVAITFNVPAGPIVFDTTLVTEAGNKGFVLLNAGAVAIVSVAITGADQVTVTLSAPPPIGSVLSYAFHNGTYESSGPIAGARGNVRDSDATLSSYTGAPLYNWCVSFKHTF